MKTKNIEQIIFIRATPAQVYEALMDSRKHSQFTGATAKIGARPGTTFTCYDNYIKGVTLDLKPRQRIVQAWRSRTWPDGHYSIVTFALAKASGGHTRLHFTQTGVPADDAAEKRRGWRTHYWEPLQKYLAG